MGHVASGVTASLQPSSGLGSAQVCDEHFAVADPKAKWSMTFRSVRPAMLAVPSRVRQRLGNLSSADAAVFQEEVRRG